ncbi:NodT family efflux transporter outer membrane factor (OMF) lipoprotein [Sphingomonas zeicaulis]|uniref:efflux transporter outer membrane subunit n=1 Tax=Sphingomonas zeicaulis TaxID=1632740 RepID=UPI003D1B16D7
MRRALPALLLAATLAACTAGPDYRPPVNAVSQQPAATGAFHSADDPAFAQAPLPDRWWRLYDDPALDALIAEALAANTDLRVADANLRRADAILRETEAGRRLATTVNGGTTLARPSGTGQGLPGTLGDDASLSLSYPLDLAGKIRRAIEAGTADREAVEAARDAARVAVVAATATAYADVCAANFELAVNQRVVALQRDTLAATQRLQKGGRGTAFDVSRAAAALDGSEATLPAFATRRQTALYRLATLLGRPPADYPAAVADCARLPDVARPIPVGDGAALIRRRPDIRAAERMIAADTARIGVATADLYPQVSLGGSIGLAGPVSGTGSAASFGFSLGPLINWSFPNRPVVRARIAQAGAQVDADIAAFDGTVLQALRETESALETYRQDRQIAARLAEARDSAALSATQADRLFRFGRGDFLSLLDAQRSLAAAEAQNAAARSRLVADQMALFTALGGGWQ